VHKHEIFSLAFFALSELIWVGDQGTGKKNGFLSQGDDSSPPPLCGLIFFEGDRCLCLTLNFVERLKCYSAKPNESCIIFGIYNFISCLISIVILSLCIFLYLLSFLVRYRVKTMQEKEKMCQTVA
jgi:hypothetical protein